MLARRLLLLMAVLMLATAVAAALAPREPVVRSGTAPPGATSPTTTPTTGTEASPGPASTGGTSSVQVDIPAGVQRPVRVSVPEGAPLRLTVRHDEPDSVELRGLDRIEPVERHTPAVFDFVADEPGTFAVQLRRADREVGRIEITPEE